MASARPPAPDGAVRAAASRLDAWRVEVDDALRSSLPKAPGRLSEAMAYALVGGGKRLRPLLVLGAAHASGPGDLPRLAWRAAVAIECVHAYSLVHDDLPAMDDDDLRRGRPTVHRAFDEASAILAGDALQALAFAHLGTGGAPGEAASALLLVAELAQAAGASGMVGGQDLDLSLAPDAGADEVLAMHALKTGALFRAAVRLGALSQGAGPQALGALSRFGEAFGRVYQALDDVDDAGADDGRPSLVRTLGRPGVDTLVQRAADAAREALLSVGGDTTALGALLDSVLRGHAG